MLENLAQACTSDRKSHHSSFVSEQKDRLELIVRNRTSGKNVVDSHRSRIHDRRIGAGAKSNCISDEIAERRFARAIDFVASVKRKCDCRDRCLRTESLRNAVVPGSDNSLRRRLHWNRAIDVDDSIGLHPSCCSLRDRKELRTPRVRIGFEKSFLSDENAMTLVL